MTNERRLSVLLSAFAHTPGDILSDTWGSSITSLLGSSRSWPTVAVADTGTDRRFPGFSNWAGAGWRGQRPATGFGVTALALGIGALCIGRGTTKEPE